MTVKRIDFAAGRRAVEARQERTDAALKVATQLFRTEAAFDVAAEETSALFSTMLIARRDAGLSSVEGQELLAEATAVQAELVSAFGRLATVHARGKAYAVTLGVRADFGEGVKKPGFAPEEEYTGSRATAA